MPAKNTYTWTGDKWEDNSNYLKKSFYDTASWPNNENYTDVDYNKFYEYCEYFQNLPVNIFIPKSGNKRI